MKHLQLNTTLLKYPEKVIDFIVKNNIDISCLQEVVYPENTQNPLVKLCEKNNLNYIEGIDYFYKPSNQIISEAIITKHEIIDYSCVYYNSKNHQPGVLQKEDLLNDIVTTGPKDFYPGSRGLPNHIKPRCVLTSLIKFHDRLIKVMTMHNSVSDLCTETIQMYEMSLLLNSLIKNSKDIPTILSGDFNIRAKSYSIEKISEVLTCHTKDLKDTLSKNHPSKEKDFPEGLAVDHVFSKGIKFENIVTIEVDFSLHKAIISIFEK